MHHPLSLALLTGALFLAGSAQAVSLTGSVLNGNSLNTDFSTPSLMAFDLNLDTSLPVSLTYTVDADDILRGGADLNAIIADTSGAGVPALQFSLAGADFDGLGAAAGISSEGEALVTNPGMQPGGVVVAFTLSEGGVVNDVYLGDPFEEGFQNWHVSFAGLQAGDSFTLSVAAVPEPAEWALMLAGLGLVAWRQNRADKLKLLG
ncbi:MAG: PEP-CTERM sorting domain-containing protein [Pseudomonadota bacterium]|jgi:hypothetical protein